MRTMLFIAGQAVGVLGGEEWSAAVSRFVSRLALRSDAIDRSAGEEMVQRMRAIVGQNSYDTGALFNGITVTHGDGETIVEASAVRDGFDYSRVVEFGRKRGPQVADDSYFAGGMEAEPFFLGTAREILEQRGADLDEAIGDLAREEKLT